MVIFSLPTTAVKVGSDLTFFLILEIAKIFKDWTESLLPFTIILEANIDSSK